MSRRTLVIGAAAALAALVFAVSRDEPPSARLRALEADPMAAYVPPGGSLVDTTSQNEGSSLGKPVSARYRRMFELPDGGAARAFEDAHATATASGWRQVGRDSARVFVADKRTPSGRIELGITLFEDSLVLPDDVKPPALLVSLRHPGS